MSRERAAREDNDCAVKALACVLRLSYVNAQAALAAAGRVEGEGTSPAALRVALEALGGRVRREFGPARLGLEVGTPYPTTLHATMNPEAWAAMGDMLLFTPGHVAALVGGTVEDFAWDQAQPIWLAWEVGEPPDEGPPPVVYL
jgi:hypothetical protein